MYPIVNSTSLEEGTIRYMCRGNPLLKVAIESAWMSETKWDDIAGRINYSRRLPEREKVHFDSELYGETILVIPAWLW